MKSVNLLGQYGHFLDTAFIGGDCFIGKARNGLVQGFIESWKTDYPADVLVFIDDDQGWDETALLRIVQDPHEVIAVAIPKKMDSDPITFNNVMLETTPDGQCFVENGLLRAIQIGSGFMAIKRGCIEKMIKAYPQRYAPGDGGAHAAHYNLFEAKVIVDEKDETVMGQFWGEDLIFCQKWCKLVNPETGLPERIWIEPNVTVEHIGRKSWTGNFLEHLQKHASVQTVDVREAKPVIAETMNELERMVA